VGLNSYGVFLRLYMKEYDRALELLERALELDPDDAQNHAALGDAYSQDKGDAARAWSFYARAVELDPKRVDALGNMAVLLMYQGDFEGALEILDRALGIDSTNALNHFNRGVVLGQLGGLDEAAEAYRKALRYDETMASGWINVGHILLDKGEADEALECFEKALALPPQPTSYRETSGLPPSRENELVIKTTTTHVIALTVTGTYYFNSGNDEEAARRLARAVELDGEYIDAVYQLGLARATMGQLFEAERLFERVLELNAHHRGAQNALEHVRAELDGGG
jgi:tetratricopeptide (TPR) repeat protein